jgi:hypothetical protein
MNINLDKLKNTKIILGILAIILIIGVLVGFYSSSILFESDPEIPYFALNSDSSDKTVILPTTAELALSEGWAGQRLCLPGRGKFATKENEPYILSYTTTGELTSIYLISNDEMPLPWRQGDNLVASGTELIDYQHWNLLVHFDNPLSSCKTLQSKNTTGYCDPIQCDLRGSGERATPTPYVSPTPTPQPSAILQKVTDNLTSSKPLKLDSGSDPDEISKMIINKATSESANLANVLSGIVSSLKNTEYESNTWIENISHKGIKGTVKSDLLQGLVSDVPSSTDLNFTIWITDDHHIKRLKIEGALNASDSKDSARTFEISEVE